jgi:hypothetical protein
LRQAVETDLQIGPSGARKPAIDFVIQSRSDMPLERRLQRRPQHALALFVRDPTLVDEPMTLSGRPLTISSIGQPLELRGYRLHAAGGFAPFCHLLLERIRT